MTADTDQPTLAVTQVDRDLYWSLFRTMRDDAHFANRGALDRGELDGIKPLQMLARHRTNSEPRAAGDLREACRLARIGYLIDVGGALRPTDITVAMAAFDAGFDAATHSPAPMADPMKVGLAIQSAWGEDDMGFDNTLPPIEFSDAELRHLGAAAIRAVAHPSTQEGGDRG